LRYGALVYFMLQVVQLLVGGGIAFFTMSLIIAVAATRIGRPLGWWHKHIHVRIRRVLAKLWLWLLLFTVTVFCALVLAAIFGIWFLDASTTTSVLRTVGLVSIGPMILAVLAGIARDTIQADGE